METVRTPLSKLQEYIPSEIDLLVVSASFELRCRSVADAIEPSRVRHVLVAQNQNHAEFHEDQANYLLKRFAGRSRLMKLHTAYPLITADSIARSFAEVFESPPRNIVVDISTFTREAFLILYRIMNIAFGRSVPKQYLYARAKEYSLGMNREEKWLSRGIADVRSVLGYPGAFEPSRRLHLIVLVGFEYDRVAELIRRCEPSVISLGQAASNEPDSLDHLDIHRYNYDRLRSVFGEVERFEFPGYDPDGARDAVLTRFRARPGFNCMLAPMNTKLSTMGAAQAAVEEPSIQIVYAQAIIYNVKAYSVPGDVCYVAGP